MCAAGSYQTRIRSSRKDLGVDWVKIVVSVGSARVFARDS